FSTSPKSGSFEHCDPAFRRNGPIPFSRRPLVSAQAVPRLPQGMFLCLLCSFTSLVGQSRSFDLLDPGQYRTRNGLIGRVDGEHFRHMAFAFEKEHRGAMIRTELT